MQANHPPVRVLFLSDHLGYAKQVVHGATTYFLQVLPRLNRSHVELTVCFFRGYHQAADRLHAEGVRPIFLNRTKWDPRVLDDVIRLVQERDIQLIHAAGVKGILIAQLAARWTGARCIIHLHDLVPLSPVMRRLQHSAARWTDAAFGISGPVCEHAIHDYGIDSKKVYLLHNALALEPYQQHSKPKCEAIRTELNIHPQAPVVAVIGRFHPLKRQNIALRVFAAVLRKVPDAVLLLIGDGPMRAACEEVARKLGISNSVRFLGQRNDVPDLLQTIDVVTITSRTEGLGYVAIEMLASGRPVVGYAVGGLPEVIVNDQTGILVPLDDEIALVDNLIRVLREPALRQRLSAGAKEHSDKFDIERHLDRLIASYHSIIDGVAPPLKHGGTHTKDSELHQAATRDANTAPTFSPFMKPNIASARAHLTNDPQT